MNAEKHPQEPPQTSRDVARRFVDARLSASALPAYPGALPAGLDNAYARQEAAIELWPDAVAGWKVGRIPDGWVDALGEERLMGPVFRRQLKTLTPGESAELRVIEGGFAAVEAEYIFILGEAADPDRSDYSPEQAGALVSSLHVGIELAGSPLAPINALGPAVVVSDIGNNAGVFLGPAIEEWRSVNWASLTCGTWIDGVLCGRGGALQLPGGPLAALAFALNRGSRRKRPLQAGMIVSTGAATGIHDIRAGQSARVAFDGISELRAHALPALPIATEKTA